MESSVSFWGDEPYSGEPATWSTSQLETWLEAADMGFTSGLGWRMDSIRSRSLTLPRSELLERVSKRLDDLYASFKPAYHLNMDHHRVRAETLPPWSRLDLAALGHGNKMPTRTAGYLERCFNSSYGIHERMLGLSRMQLPVGLHPLDDYRQNILIITKSFDEERNRCIIMQGCVLSVRDVRLLPPGGRLKPSSSVVLLKRFGSVGASVAGDPVDQYLGHRGVVEGLPSGRHAHVRFSSLVDSSAVFRIEIVRLALVHGCGLKDGPCSWVVFKDLKSKPELNGRLGRTALGAIASHQADSERIEVHVLDWERPLAGVLGEPSVSRVIVRSLLKNLEGVADIKPAVIVASCCNKASDISAGGACFLQKLTAEISKVSAHAAHTQNIKCTLREIRMFVAALKGTTLDFTHGDGSESALLQDRDARPRQVRARLLGNLDPKMWQLSVLTPTEPPLPPEEVAKRQLKRMAGSCRHCLASDVPLSRCLKCLAVSYCSRSCQSADWKARHKLECKGMISATGVPQKSDQQDAQDEKDGFIVVEMVGGGDEDIPYSMCLETGRTFNLNEMPKNLHGDREFIVKVQNGFDMSMDPFEMIRRANDDSAMFTRPIAIYDQPKSFWVTVGKAKCPDQHAALVGAIKAFGRMGGKMHPLGRKVYLYARRVGGTLNVTVCKRVPGQDQPW